MSNIIIIEPDKKISFQMTKLFEEISNDNKLFVFETIESFESILFDSEQKTKSPFPCPTVDILIFHAGLLQAQEINEWCKKIYSKLVQTKRFHQDKLPHDSIHFVAGTYENDEVSKFELMIPYIKDIIYYPIDRLLFMQKMEVLLALPKKTTPSFLFSEKVDLPIEISKRSEIIRINEVGFQIENPVQLTKGTTAHFYLHLEKNIILDANARVSNYRPSTSQENSFIVNFIFEGLTENDNKTLRLFLAKQNCSRLLIKDKDEEFLLNPLDMFATPEDKTPKNIALIIENEAIGGRLKEVIEKSLSPVRVIYENSLQEFHHKYLPHNRIPVANTNDMSISKLSFLIDSNTKQFQNFIGTVSSTDHILNKPIELIFKSEDGWNKILNTQTTKDEFLSQLQSLQPETPKVFTISLGLDEVSPKLFQITLFLIPKKQQIQIHIEAPKVEELFKNSGILPRLDLMILDDKNTPEGMEAWKTQINNYLNKNKLLKKTNSYLRVLRLAEKVQESDINSLRDKHIQSIHSKSMHKNHLLTSISDLLKIKYTKFKWDNFNWLEVKKPLHIGTASHLESLSEFGAFIKHARPIAPGTFLFLHKSIFDQAPNKSLCVRFYYTEEDPADKESHLSYFTYFGINDSFLKYVRSWIRENYAAKKNL